MSKSGYILILCLLTSCLSLSGQQTLGLEMKEGVRRVEIPFEYKNGFILVDIIFNNILPLKFIFDTGAEYTIINKREVTDLFGLDYEKEFRLLGSDMTTELIAYLTRGVDLNFDQLYGTQQDVLVLAEDYFNIEDYTGIEVHGILGANFFKRYVIQIDYRRKILTFIKPETFDRPEAGYKKVRTLFKKNKPYLQVGVEITKDSILPLSILLDSGASLALLIHSNSHPDIRLPQNIIEGQLAMGLGGYLTGYLGRVHQLRLNDDLSFQNVLCHFQKITIYQDTTHLNSRNGVVGNLILDRFSIIVDYPRERIYFKPNKKYKKKFKYDKSGMSIIASGNRFNTFSVHHVLQGSPADLAGVKVGDEIIGVNFLHSSFYSLNHLIKILQRKDGKKIRLKIKRNGKKMILKFRLKTLI